MTRIFHRVTSNVVVTAIHVWEVISAMDSVVHIRAAQDVRYRSYTEAKHEADIFTFLDYLSGCTDIKDSDPVCTPHCGMFPFGNG